MLDFMSMLCKENVNGEVINVGNGKLDIVICGKWTMICVNLLRNGLNF